MAIIKIRRLENGGVCLSTPTTSPRAKKMWVDWVWEKRYHSYFTPSGSFGPSGTGLECDETMELVEGSLPLLSLKETLALLGESKKYLSHTYDGVKGWIAGEQRDV